MIEKYEVVIIMMKTDTQDFLNSCFVDFQIRHLSAPVPQMITNSLRGLVLNLINLNCLKLLQKRWFSRKCMCVRSRTGYLRNEVELRNVYFGSYEVMVRSF